MYLAAYAGHNNEGGLAQSAAKNPHPRPVLARAPALVEPVEERARRHAPPVRGLVARALHGALARVDALRELDAPLADLAHEARARLGDLLRLVLGAGNFWFNTVLTSIQVAHVSFFREACFVESCRPASRRLGPSQDLRIDARGAHLYVSRGGAAAALPHAYAAPPTAPHKPHHLAIAVNRRVRTAARRADDAVAVDDADARGTHR